MLTTLQILSPLNDKQKEAVHYTEGPVLVLAGAGSGKTRCIVHRIAYLISCKKVNPQNILAVTFTNKAANEMKERLKNSFNISTYSLWIGTFHSMCARILRAESDSYSKIPFSSNFTIFDANDQNRIMKNVIKKMNISDTNFPPKKVLNIISLQKNNLVNYKNFSPNDSSYYSKIIGQIFENYQKYLLENNGLDFDDLLAYTVWVFEKFPEILKKYQEKFKYLLIDEYQDTNFAQYQMTYLLAKSHKNICVVGDDDQSIYGWRGADIRNILSFENDYKTTKIVRMTQNYRSPELVLSAANELIANNESRHKKELWTAKGKGKKIQLYEVPNGKYEAIFISKKIRELINSGKADYKEITIFYRTNAQSREFETQFLKDRINYQIVGGVNFYQRKEIKDILAYLRILANPSDNESLLRIINFPKRGIGKVAQSKLLDFASHKKIHLYSALQKIDKTSKFSNSALKKMKSFYSILKKFSVKSKSEPINKLVKEIVAELNLLDFYKNEELIKGETRADNIKEFIASTEDFAENFFEEFSTEPKLSEYLQNISLITDIDRTDKGDNVVSLMTMHNAKGLEFPYVFIVGAEDGLIPHTNSMDSVSEIEEERRLLYVAMTRTIKELTMSYANSRRFFNSYISNFPSRFLDEINDKHFEKFILTSEFNKQYSGDLYKSQKRKTDWKTAHNKFKVGQRISHSKFGQGMILSIRGNGDDAKLTISFNNGELKKIISSFVKSL
ncbi:MAG: UvrD-helicase domain-containing protein [Candidatus Cloacimonetes bacterium]|nr:UvrD-helicase domain-containing protein [Candidatus Cloacimonadota bacterium]